MRHVGLHRCLGEDQVLRNCAVRQALASKRKDLLLAVRQGLKGIGQATPKLADDVIVHHCLSASGLADALGQFFWGTVLRR